jgi:uncharacterized protein YkwD
LKRKSWPLRLWALGLLVSLLNTSVISTRASVPQSRLLNAYDVINAVNQLRAANGLPPYQVNGALMASAQAHSDYQAATGQITHTGQGGSNAKSRAIAAGYGGGAAVFVSENIYGGGNVSAQQAVNWWMGDALHQNTMLSPNYVDAGAGVATNGNTYYYTLDVGYIAGSPGSGGTSSTAQPLAASTAIAFVPVQIASPAADGSIVHVVQPGQTLWTIAAAYKVSLPEILELNKMTANTTIYPGNKITVKGPDATPTSTPTETFTPGAPTLTKRPTRERTATVTELAIAETSSPKPGETIRRVAAEPGRSGFGDPLLMIILTLVGGGVLLVLLGSLLQRRG